MKRKRKDSQVQLPTTPQLEEALSQEERRKRFHSILRSTVFVLTTVAAVSILIATLLFPVMRIYGNSMNPTLEDGQIVVALKVKSFTTGDLVAFYYNNKLLIKRVICGPGDWFNITEDGTVFVNGTPIDEPYVKLPCSWNEPPHKVSPGCIYVMGDHRSTSIDSRSSIVGCVSKDQVVGKILIRVWPLGVFGAIP